MGFFDWLFSNGASTEGGERLKAAVDRVIEGTDPRLKAISGARDRLAPAVEHALAYAHEIIARIPAGVELTPENWSATPLLKAFFTRPADIAETLSISQDLRNFLKTNEATGIETLFAVVAATRVERTVLGSVMEGDILRQDVAQKAVSFTDFRVAGFCRSEADVRRLLEDFVLEQLVLAALRDVASNKQRSDQLGAYRQLLLTRLRLLEQSGAGVNTMLDTERHESTDLGRLRSQLAANEAELNELKPAGVGLEAYLDPVIEALHNAESIIRPKVVSLRLNAMNIIVGPEAIDSSEISLVEFSTVNPDRPRRVGFLVQFPRSTIVERAVDLDALLRSI
ncbi:MAG: hypothetical protein QG672_506 [Pseudomonadota bacterium]|nr:hypothetical protein [Pseudomonadota bacterium]